MLREYRFEFERIMMDKISLKLKLKILKPTLQINRTL